MNRQSNATLDGGLSATPQLSDLKEGTYPLLGESMYASRLVATVLAVTVLATLDVAAYTYGGSPVGISVFLASVLGFTSWVTTTRRRPRSAPAAFNLYIGTVVALTVLEAEEWCRRMPTALMHLYPNSFRPGVGISDHAFIAVFPLAGSGFLLLGALAYFHGTAFGRFAAWFTFAWSIVAGLSVYAFALLARAPFEYMGGMITAPVPVLLALAGMHRLIQVEGLGDHVRSSQGIAP